MHMRPLAKHIRILLCVALAVGGCATLRSLESHGQREYFIELEPVLPDGETYYTDPIDSSVVWSEQGVQVKVKFYDDAMLDAEYGTSVSRPIRSRASKSPAWTIRRRCGPFLK